MKHVIYIIILLFFSCNSENALDCFQKSGAIITKEVVMPAFNTILVNRNIELIVTDKEEQRITIEAGENLISDITVGVINNQLILTDNNTCNYVRNYRPTRIYVDTPNLTEVRSSTQYDVKSNGVLSYPNLKIISEDFGKSDLFTVGDFRLDIDTESFSVVFNNISACYVSGQTSRLNLNYAIRFLKF